MPTEAELKKWKEVHIPEAMGNLRRAYEAVYNDAYRASGVGFFRRYLNRFDHMVSVMADALKIVYAPRWSTGKREDAMPWRFFHDVFTHIFNAKHGETDEDDKNAMVILEKYLMQVHHFLDTQKFDLFTVYSSNEKRWWDYEFIKEDGIYSIADDQLEEYAATYKGTILKQYREGLKAGGWSDPKHWTQSMQSVARRLLIMEKEGKL